MFRSASCQCRRTQAAPKPCPSTAARPPQQREEQWSRRERQWLPERQGHPEQPRERKRPRWAHSGRVRLRPSETVAWRVSCEHSMLLLAETSRKSSSRSSLLLRREAGRSGPCYRDAGATVSSGPPWPSWLTRKRLSDFLPCTSEKWTQYIGNLACPQRRLCHVVCHP